MIVFFQEYLKYVTKPSPLAGGKKIPLQDIMSEDRYISNHPL